MGTRNLTIVHLEGEYKVAQYGQWDGYPSGNGVKVLEFLRKRLKTKKANKTFRANVKAASFITDAEVDDINERCKSGALKDWTKEYPQLSRDMGADILDFILDQPPGVKLRDSLTSRRIHSSASGLMSSTWTPTSWRSTRGSRRSRYRRRHASPE
jgi:hypothetical protein